MLGIVAQVINVLRLILTLTSKKKFQIPDKLGELLLKQIYTSHIDITVAEKMDVNSRK